jgi:DNA-binding NarL/FixJ family response regulator
MIRVRIVARSPVTRAGLAALLGRDPTLQLLPDAAPSPSDGSAGATAEVVVVEWEASHPDPGLVAWVDGDLPEGTALVLLVDDLDAAVAGALLRSGARAVLPETATEDELRGAIAAAAAGLATLPARLLERLLPTARESAPPAPGDASLTAREHEVLDALAEGMSNKAIARRLGISERTAKAHVAAILGKLGAATRTEAVTAGVRRGIILL